MSINTVAIYLRVSTTEQAGSDKVSLEQQEGGCRSLIEAKHGDNVETVVFSDDGVSGVNSEADRPAFNRMMQAARLGEINEIVLGLTQITTIDFL